MSAIPIGAPAPEFSFADETGAHSLGEFRGTPVILVFVPAEQRATEPILQHLTFEGEQLPVLTVRDESVPRHYGVETQFAVFLVASNGTIAWRHAADTGALIPLSSSTGSGLSRREFVAAMLAASVAATFTRADNAFAAAPAVEASSVHPGAVDIAFIVNGRSTQLSLDPRATLLDMLREDLRLTGTKKGCDHGQCGACTVHVDGRRVLSCLTLAATLEGKSITTIEGLASGDELHPMQQAFIQHDGFQCGYCTAGQIMSAVALLREPCGPDDDDVRECMSGNICRCGAYAGIVAAVQSVRGKT